MPVGSVAAYQAALETTNTAMSYAMESTWATAPATTFQAMRILSESLAHKKTRTRPSEIRGDRQSAPALTTQEGASGSIVFPVFYAETGRASQFDDFLSATLGGDWQVPTVIAGVGGDIALSSGSLLTSTTAAKFAGILVSQVLKLNGFTNAVNNRFFRVAQVISSTSLQLAPMGFTAIAETPAGTAAKISYSNLRNGPSFKSVYAQQRLDPAGTKWFRYPGGYPTKMGLTLSLSQFLQASVDMAIQQELKGTADVSTGGIIPAPNTRDLDPVAGFKGVFWNDAALTAGVTSAGFDLTNDGAGAEYFLGSALAQGMMGGTFMANGKVTAAFRDFSLYDSFRSESTGTYAVQYADQTGNSYVFTMPNALLLFDNGVPVTGPNKMITADVTVEGSPSSDAACTISVDRFPASA